MTAEPDPPVGSRSPYGRLEQLLEDLGLAGLPERELPTDGWSGARFSMIERPAHADRPFERFVLKRTSPVIDWIAAATGDTELREGRLAASERRRVAPSLRETQPYLGAAIDDDGSVVIAMPDLSAELLAWERPAHDRAEIDVDVVERVLDRLAALHAAPWPAVLDPGQPWAGGLPPFPWCPLPERLTLTARPTCARHVERGIPAGVESARKLLAGWDAFDRTAPASARALVDALGADPAPLVAALGRLPAVGLHGDLKLANVAIGPGPDQVRFIDWQMTIQAPIAVELGWFLVTNSASLPEAPEPLLDRYRTSLSWHLDRISSGSRRSDEAAIVGDWEAQVDLAWIVGLLLRGWRKGLDTESDASLGSGGSGADDLAFWCDRAVDAAQRRL
jgi:hypothetical protein